MNIESTNNNTPTTPAITYSECYVHPLVSLYNEDCRETMKRIPDGSVDLIVTDPPYGSLDLEWDQQQDYEYLFKEWLRIIKENGAIIITSQQPYATDVIIACKKYFRYEIIWEKTQKMGFVNASKMPLRGHENILVFYKKLPTYNPIKYETNKDKNSFGRVRKQTGDRYKGYSGGYVDGEYCDDGTRLPHSVVLISNWNGALFGNNTNATFHPTQKPVDLMRYLILTYSNKGETVFDGYSGSGTTAHACLVEGRKFIGSELDKGYFEKSVKRLKSVPTQLF